MRIYHWTVSATAAVIMSDGFKDSAQKYVSDFAWSGVWVSDRPICPDTTADTLLILDVPEHVFTTYEWIYEGAPYRGSLIPAIVLNKLGKPQISSETPMPRAAPSTTSAA